MKDPQIYLDLALCFIAGVGLALLYFGGLWLTILRMHRTRRPALLLGASFAARIAVLLLGLYLVSGGSLLHLAACFVGFLCCRGVLMRRLGRSGVSLRSSHGNHEPRNTHP